MSQALAAAAVLAWTLGAAAMPVVMRFWLRAGRRRLGFLVFVAIMATQLALLVQVARQGLDALREPSASFSGWAGWVLGGAGLAALSSGLVGTGLRSEPSRGGAVRDPDRAAEIGLGLFGLGFLLRQLALVL